MKKDFNEVVIHFNEVVIQRRPKRIMSENIKLETSGQV